MPQSRPPRLLPPRRQRLPLSRRMLSTLPTRYDPRTTALLAGPYIHGLCLCALGFFFF
ncbi:hypothetical protein EDD21DRAFT_448808, partial [Dissophora ornata]